MVSGEGWRERGSGAALQPAPDVEDVRRLLFVVAVGAVGFDEAVAFVEPLRTDVRGEGP